MTVSLQPKGQSVVIANYDTITTKANVLITPDNGVGAINLNAICEFRSTTQAVLMPRVPTINAGALITEGMAYYDSTMKKHIAVIDTGKQTVVTQDPTTGQAFVENLFLTPTGGQIIFAGTNTLSNNTYIAAVPDASNVLFTLPANNGAINNILITNGNGSTSWSGTPTVDSIKINNAPIANTDGVNKQYADALIAGLSFKNPCAAASTTNLTAAYTPTGGPLVNTGANAAFQIDGYTAALNDRILIKNQTTSLQNGIYTVAVVGNGSTPWQLTRAVDYNTPAEITAGSITFITNGTVNANTSWIETSTVTTIGTDAITFSQFSYGPSTFLQAANNLSDVVNKPTAVSNLGLSRATLSNANNIAVAGYVPFFNDATGTDLLYGGAGASTIFSNVNGTLTISSSVVELASLSGTTSNPGALQLGGSLKFSKNSHIITLQADSSLSSTYALTLPNTAGTTGQVLTTSGATGILNWATSTTGTVTEITVTGPNLTGGTINTTGTIALNNTLTELTSVTTTSLTAGFEPQGNCVAASITNLNTLYDNGTLGVEATLTDNSGTFDAFMLDDYMVSVEDRILIKDQSNQYENGIYTLTRNGDTISLPWVLTRAAGYDEPTEILIGTKTLITNGTVNNGSTFAQSLIVTTIGTSNIAFINMNTLTSDVTIANSYTLGNIVVENGSIVTLNGSIQANNGNVDTQSVNISQAAFKSGGSSGVTLKASNSMPANTSLTLNLPINNGTANQVLTTDGSGNTRWNVPIVDWKNTCNAATTVNLAAVYANGTVGVGATLTAISPPTTLSVIDGITLVNGNRLLVKNQTDAFQNGIYVVTDVDNWTLTRATDYDTVAEISQGNIIGIMNGTLNANTTWKETAVVATIGTSSITLSQFSGVTSVATGTGLSGGPITSTGTISLASTAVTAGSYTYAGFTVNPQGQLTAASSGFVTAAGAPTAGVATITTDNMTTGNILTTAVTANSIILITRDENGTAGSTFPNVYVASRVANASFVINSSIADTATYNVNWVIINP